MELVRSLAVPLDEGIRATSSTQDQALGVQEKSSDTSGPRLLYSPTPQSGSTLSTGAQAKEIPRLPDGICAKHLQARRARSKAFGCTNLWDAVASWFWDPVCPVESRKGTLQVLHRDRDRGIRGVSGPADALKRLHASHS